MAQSLEAIVIGGGQAGLAASYLLTKEGVSHVVLERDKIGESWRSQRWDSFHLNTPNWANSLPGAPFHPESPDGFSPGGDLVRYLETYALANGLPVRTGVEVTSLEARPGGGYRVRTSEAEFLSPSVVVAAGGQSLPRVPKAAAGVSSEIEVLSAATYRNSDLLPQGAVLVVGSGQSGCQIAEDLLEAGRRVYLSTSKVGRLPRAYRGCDAVAWMRDLGHWEVRLESLENPAQQFAAQPQISGTRGGHTLSLQSLAAQGATLVGRVAGIEGHIVTLDPIVRSCIEFADSKSTGFKAEVDAHVAKNRIAAPEPLVDPGEPEVPDLGGSDEWTRLDLRQSGVRSVIWCTGFAGDWNWIHVEIFDTSGLPRHRGGVTEAPGLYFLGLPWLSRRKSGILYGVGDDAGAVVGHLLGDLGRRPS